MKTFNRKAILVTIAVMLTCLVLAGSSQAATPQDLKIGWSQVNITPATGKLTPLLGQMMNRLSVYSGTPYSGYFTPIYSTVLAMETVDSQGASVEQSIMISNDLFWSRQEMLDRIRAYVASSIPDFDTSKLFMNATHSHSAPGFKDGDFFGVYDTSGLPGDIMTQSEYGDYFLSKVGPAVIQAWNNRAAGGISWAKGSAVVGYNRKPTGAKDLYEGYQYHGQSMLFFWNASDQLTGILINTSAPSQIDGWRHGAIPGFPNDYYMNITADFWHYVRQDLRSVYGQSLYVFPQLGAAGDQTPGVTMDHAIELEMRDRRGLGDASLDYWFTVNIVGTMKEISRRICNDVDNVYPYVQGGNIQDKIDFKHEVAMVDMPLRVPLIQPFYRTDDPPLEIHCLQLGDIAIATNPFEFYIDFGMRIKARSDAVDTLISQLSCGHTGYLPTVDAVAGGTYGSVNNIVGPPGAQVLVNHTVNTINAMFADESVQQLIFTESGSVTAVDERTPTGVTSDSYEVGLATAPTANVTVTLSYDSSQLIVSPTTLVFNNNANWSDTQTVTVTAINNGPVEGSHTENITHTASGGNYAGVSKNLVVDVAEDFGTLDLAAMASQWLDECSASDWCNGFDVTGVMGLTTEAGTADVDFRDFALLANQWIEN